MHYHKKLLKLLTIFYCALSYAQSNKQDTLRGEFTYRLKAKFDTRTDYRYEEGFLLKIGDNRAFFTSVISLKGDSVMTSAGITSNNTDGSIILGWKAGVVIPKTNFNFTIIQTSENVQYFDSAGTSLFTYKEPVIKNWKLVDETKVISTVICKKAELRFKGRNWTAWYAPEIPLPYGPMKFSDLPGLIVKVTDDKGDYDFELIKSLPVSKLRGEFINIRESRYKGAIETTQVKLKQAQRNADANAAGVLSNYGATIVKGQEMIRQREKEMEENKKYANPLEISDE